MADRIASTERRTFISLALSTLGSDPVWDAALHRYLRAFSLEFADFTFGEYAQASEEFDRAIAVIEHKYGKAYRAIEDGSAMADAAWAGMHAAEDRQSTEFYGPLWEAEQVLIAAPAPTVAAAVFKVDLLDRAGMKDCADWPDMMSTVRADLDRVCGIACIEPA